MTGALDERRSSRSFLSKAKSSVGAQMQGQRTGRKGGVKRAAMLAIEPTDESENHLLKQNSCRHRCCSPS